MSGGDSSEVPPCGWAILGTGRVADQYVAPAIRAAPGARLVGVCGRTTVTAAAFGARHDVARVYESLGELLSDPEIRVVYIATPNHLHAEEVEACANAGRDILCDKPLALSESAAVRAVAACQAAGVQLGIMLQARRYGGVLMARDLVSRGVIGEVRLAHIEIGTGSGPLRGWRAEPALAGMGALNNVGVHVLDALSFVLGEAPIEVSAMTSSPEPSGLETTAVLLLRYPSGVLATAAINQSAKIPRCDMAFFGTAGTIEGHDVTRPEASGRIDLTAEDSASFEVTSHGAHAETIGRFNAAIRDGQPVFPSGEDGLASVRLIDAVSRAVNTGRVVSL